MTDFHHPTQASHTVGSVRREMGSVRYRTLLYPDKYDTHPRWEKGPTTSFATACPSVMNKCPLDRRTCVEYQLIRGLHRPGPVIDSLIKRIGIAGTAGEFNRE